MRPSTWPRRGEGHSRQGGQPQGLSGGDRRRRGIPDIQPGRYTYIDTVTDFKYGTDLAANFNGQIKNLKTLGRAGACSSSKAFVFVVNHDRERGHGAAACSPS